jgi:hypothetical protein
MDNKMSWIPFKEVDFSDKKIKQYHIDTRDFNCLCLQEGKEVDIDLNKTRNNPENYFHTSQEIADLLQRYYEESGGAGEWRFFSLTGEAKFRTDNWQMKYIRIFRFDQGLIVTSGNRDERFVMGKHMLSCSVNKRESVLNHY